MSKKQNRKTEMGKLIASQRRLVDLNKRLSEELEKIYCVSCREECVPYVGGPRIALRIEINKLELLRSTNSFCMIKHISKKAECQMREFYLKESEGR